MIRTFRFRLKGNTKPLIQMAKDVNFVWNYCNETSFEYLRKKNKWVTAFDLINLTSGCSKDLSIAAKTIEVVCKEFATRRKQYKKPRLSWRSAKRSLSWVPFENDIIKFYDNHFTYRGVPFKFWKSQEITGVYKCGSFTQDAKGNWYVCFTCEIPNIQTCKSVGEVGIDLGLKTLATTSDGQAITRDNITLKLANDLATAQRARKKKRVKAIHQKIKNTRKDWAHKVTTQLVNQYDRIFVGDVSPSKLTKTRMAKSVSDAGWYDFKTMLAYKAIALGVEYHEVKENFSTVTCSVCFERSGPSGLSALGVREWICSCGASHDRDVNAAKNILRFGHESLKGVLSKTRKVPTSSDTRLTP